MFRLRSGGCPLPGTENTANGRLRPGSRAVPRHVAVIMDGNRRYAGKHGIEKGLGHRMGTKTTRRVIEWAYEAGIRQLTVYAFSTENFNRDREEVRTIFALLAEKLTRLINDENTMKRGLCVRMIGDSSLLPPEIVSEMRALEEKTKNNDRMYVNIALAYGGRQDLAQAFSRILADPACPAGKTASVSELIPLIEQNLFPADGKTLPDVDLVIRTGGEQRTSNFLSWQANGSRAAFYVSEKMWPEFGLIDFRKALMAYAVSFRRRCRRDAEREACAVKI